MAKVKTIREFQDKNDKMKLVPVGTTLDLTPERHAELAARLCVPPLAAAEEPQPEAPAPAAAK